MKKLMLILEDGKEAYGQGIWAPSFRYHDGTFYIFSNVNRRRTQLFRAKNPAGPWTRTELNRSFHDLSVLFDTDGRAAPSVARVNNSLLP